MALRVQTGDVGSGRSDSKPTFSQPEGRNELLRIRSVPSPAAAGSALCAADRCLV